MPNAAIVEEVSTASYVSQSLGLLLPIAKIAGSAFIAGGFLGSRKYKGLERDQGLSLERFTKELELSRAAYEIKTGWVQVGSTTTEAYAASSLNRGLDPAKRSARRDPFSLSIVDSPDPKVLAEFERALGMKAWLLDSLFAGPFRLGVEFLRGVSSEEMASWWLTGSSPVDVKATTARSRSAWDDSEADTLEFGILALYPSAVIRSVEGNVFWENQQGRIRLLLPSPLELIDPSFAGDAVPEGSQFELDIAVVAQRRSDLP